MLRFLPSFVPVFAAGVVIALPVCGQAFLEDLQDHLTFANDARTHRMRISGTLEVETWWLPDPPPGIIEADDGFLLNPRLSVFLDGQCGEHWYAFAQARVDRGFDPSDHSLEARLDEYAVRFTPWVDGRLTVQAGMFATVFGEWGKRHLSWDHAFVSAPLAYEHVTAIYDTEPPATAADFLAVDEDDLYEYNPVIWGPSYATGIALAGMSGPVEWAVEVKNASLSSRPEVWSVADMNFSAPTTTAHLSYRPNPMWRFGLSGSRGAYFQSELEDPLPDGTDRGDFKQTVWGQDVSFAWHRWQVWAELVQASFDVPNVGKARVSSGFLEIKHVFAPQYFWALRANYMDFGRIPDGLGGRVTWGRDLARLDVALGYRPTEFTQVKVQVSGENPRGGAGRVLGVVQLTARF